MSVRKSVRSPTSSNHPRDRIKVTKDFYGPMKGEYLGSMTTDKMMTPGGTRGNFTQRTSEFEVNCHNCAGLENGNPRCHISGFPSRS